MTILFVIDSIGTSHAGTESQLFQLIEGLRERGHTVHLFCLWDTDWLRKNSAHLGYDVWVTGIQHFGRWRTYSNVLRLRNKVRSIRPDIVQAFFPTSSMLMPIVARLAGVRVALSSRRDCGLWHSTSWLAATSIANLFVSGIVANSEAVKRSTLSTEWFAAGKVVVLYNGIDWNHFSKNPVETDAGFRAQWDIPREHMLVGMVANLRPVKRHHTFLQAAQAVLARRSDVTFIVIGDGGMRSELEALTADLGISSNVRFLGRIANVECIVPLLDIGVSASTEGFSNAIMEYMFAGVVPVVAQSGGNIELIEDDVNGFTFPLDDSNELARCLEKTLANPSCRDRFRQRSAAKLKDFSLDKMVRRYEQYYETVLERANVQIESKAVVKG